ncbi:DGQHR domain-containing protein [Dokdonia sp. LLG6352-1]|uniref:DGQHR domain-containing protein n=1 Tax=Dokdonia sp. LLG6352-1 TaxID=3160831 RepID=UPI00386FAA04
MIHLACTHGNLGYWDYYSTVIKVEDVVRNNRIITVAESEELFTENINAILQREIKTSRIKALKTYINETDERFIGSIVAAIHKGEPKWTEIDINQNFEIDGLSIDELSIDFLNSKFGVLTLMGNEQIFALDGQHRLKGLRKAYAENPEIVGKLEVSILFVVHQHTKLEKTRRLFTVLNKYAEKPKGAELIILDEDDAAAIISRRLVTEHEHLSKSNGISNSKSANIPTSDNNSFSTLVTINAVNKILFKKSSAYYTKRPSDIILNNLYQKACEFWDAIFEAFPELILYINGQTDININGQPINRADETGGSLLLRPVGHKLLAQTYIKFDENQRQQFIDKIRLVDFNLSSQNWQYIFWNEKMIGKELTLKKNLLAYLVGKYDDADYIHDGMSRIYETYNEDYDNHIEPV